MKYGFLVACVCLLLLMTFDAKAQSAALPNQSWDDLKQMLIPGKVMVETKPGKKLTGQLKSASDTALEIERKGKIESFSRDEVKTVWIIAPPNRFKRAVFGAAGFAGGLYAGIFIAVGLGFKDCGGNCVDEGTGIVAALVGLPVAGALVGRWLAGSGKRTLVYSAP